MSQLHEAMVQQLSDRHVDLTEELATIETRSLEEQQLVLQKVPSEANPKVRNHGEGPY